VSVVLATLSSSLIDEAAADGMEEEAVGGDEGEEVDKGAGCMDDRAEEAVADVDAAVGVQAASVDQGRLIR
jgi:hypothetical protein